MANTLIALCKGWFVLGEQYDIMGRSLCKYENPLEENSSLVAVSIVPVWLSWKKDVCGMDCPVFSFLFLLKTTSLAHF